MGTEKYQAQKAKHNDKNDQGHRHQPAPEKGKNGGSQDERRHEGNQDHNKKH